MSYGFVDKVTISVYAGKGGDGDTISICGMTFEYKS